MGKRTMKTAALAALLGSVFQLGGCIADAISVFFASLPAQLVTELVTDNNSVFDLFVD